MAVCGAAHRAPACLAGGHYESGMVPPDMKYYEFTMALYRLRRTIYVQKLTGFPRPTEHRAQSAPMQPIKAGEIVEVVSSPNSEGRVLIRYECACYRVWKEELKDVHTAERVTATTQPSSEQRHA